MKKGLLALVLVLSLAPVANATVIDAVTDGVGSKGHAGTIDDPLEVGETIEIKLVLNHNPYPGYPSYDGYLLSSMDTMLNVSGPGTLQERHAKNPWTGVPGNEIRLWDTYFTPLRGPTDIPLRYPYDTRPIMDLRIVAVGCEYIFLDLSINGLGEYAPYGDPLGNPWPGWIPLVDEDLGDLALYVALTGDIDGDWDVDLDDFACFASQWRRTGCGQCDGADLTGDGNVDFTDLDEFSKNWLGDCF